MLHHYAHKERPLISTLILAIGVVFSLSSMLYASSQVTTLSLTILAPTENTGSSTSTNGSHMSQDEDDDLEIGCDSNHGDIGCNIDTENIDQNIEDSETDLEHTHNSAEQEQANTPSIDNGKGSINQNISHTGINT